jgi:hypothetical protein
VELPIRKISEVIFVSASQLLVLHAPYQYSLFHVLDRYEMKLLKKGRLPGLVEKVKKISEQTIAFIYGH